MSQLRFILLLLLISALFFTEDWITVPSCKKSAKNGVFSSDENDLKVMIVADLLLLGNDAGYAEKFFRHPFMSKFFRKSLEKLEPDMLLVLGDISAKGWKLPWSKWLGVLEQFDEMLDPFLGLPIHVALGDRDVGECSKLDVDIVSRLANNLPGLGSGGNSAFEIGSVSFVSLNSIAMLCGNNRLRFGVEKIIESESVGFQNLLSYRDSGKAAKPIQNLATLQWRENEMESGSGPVLLLHFPLYRSTESICRITYSRDSELSNMGPYDLRKTLSANATEYIFHALKPRIVFTAHTQKFCDHMHPDGTREVTLPAMTWGAKRKPGFIYVTFGQNKTMNVHLTELSFPPKQNMVKGLQSIPTLACYSTAIVKGRTLAVIQYPVPVR